MTGKFTIVVPVSKSNHEIIKVLEEYCFMVADIRAVAGRNIMLEIEYFTNFDNNDTN